MTECIVLHLLPLRQPDLDKWQEDPEEFIKDEEEEKWRFDVRVGDTAVSISLTSTYICREQPCAQAMLKELMREYSHVVLQVNEYRMRYQRKLFLLLYSLTSLFQAKTRSTDAASFEDLLVKEAIYTAIGDCPSEFSSAQRPDGSPILAYPEWLANSLAPEANSTDPA